MRLDNFCNFWYNTTKKVVGDTIMIYVMSDLHGEYDKFINMLNKIEFSSKDTLYILGDVLDRGEKSLEIIDYIRRPENNNIKLLMGNHEQFCIS